MIISKVVSEVVFTSKGLTYSLTWCVVARILVFLVKRCVYIFVVAFEVCGSLKNLVIASTRVLAGELVSLGVAIGSVSISLSGNDSEIDRPWGI